MCGCNVLSVKYHKLREDAGARRGGMLRIEMAMSGSAAYRSLSNTYNANNQSI